MPTTFNERVVTILSEILLPFNWELEYTYETMAGHWILRVYAKDAFDNVTGADISWKGRKWPLSQHMTDGEIVQTAFLACMTAVEHEIRETFFYKGQPIFDPHYNIDKLVELRKHQTAIKMREPST